MSQDYINQSKLSSIKPALVKDSDKLISHNSQLNEVCASFDSISFNVYCKKIPNVTVNCLTVGNKEIRDNPRVPGLKFELPKLPGSCAEITTPTHATQVTSLVTPGTNDIVKITPGVEQQKKYANSTTLKMKHKRMKKHRLKRMRKRLESIHKKARYIIKTKKEKKFANRLNQLKVMGEQFDAERFVKQKLQKAKRGGYAINILETANWR